MPSLPVSNSLPEVRSWFCNEAAPCLPEGEAEPAFWYVMEEILGIQRSRALAEGPFFFFSEGQLRKLLLALKDIKSFKPLQYITRRVWFMGLCLYLDSRCLIPRPETEELVAWMTQDLHVLKAGSILDVGTGSGAIALALKSLLPAVRVSGMDVSAEALEVARRNAGSLGIEVDFFQADILHEEFGLQGWDVVVSNPPYIPEGEKSTLQRQVRDWEPPQALFVPDEDPFLFYRAIIQKLSAGQVVFFELGPRQAKGLEGLARSFGAQQFDLRSDSQGNLRMAKVVR